MNQGREIILLIDDDLKLAEMLSSYLEKHESIRKIIIYNFNMLYKKLNLSISSQFGESHISMFRFF